MPHDYDIDTDDLPSMDEYDTGRFVRMSVAIAIIVFSTDAKNKLNQMNARSLVIRYLDWDEIINMISTCR